MSRIAASASIKSNTTEGGDAALSGAKVRLSADATSGNNSLTTAIADFDLIADTASNGLTALLGASVAYSDTTHQYSGTMGGNATITPTQGAALYALLNTTATALLAVKTALAGVPISEDVVIDVNKATVKGASALRRICDKLVAHLASTLGP